MNWLSRSRHGWKAVIWIASNAYGMLLPLGGLAADPDVASPLLSYQYLNTVVNSPGQPNVASPLVSYQYVEWPTNLTQQSIDSSLVSYFYNIGAQGPNVALHGRVIDSSGAPLEGATVSALVYQYPQATAQTAADGTYSLAPLPPGIYACTASLAKYAISARVLTLSAATAHQDFELMPLPPTPTTTQVDRSPTVSYTTGPMGSTLKIFDGTAFVDIDATHKPEPSVITIVLTHGWIPSWWPIPGPSGIADWPTKMASQLRSQGITTNIANIVGWDWRIDATQPVPPQTSTPRQGAALGTNLLAALHADYAQPIHFLGHSLGTMVNAAAINFLHGERLPATHADIAPTPWPLDSQPLVHVTLFDEASEATANTGDSQFAFDGMTASQTVVPSLLPADNNSTLTYASPLPMHFKWADNYVSAVGFYHNNAVNILLEWAALHPGDLLHSYALDWYGQSIANPADPGNPLGFQQSFEYEKEQSMPLSGIPPTGLSEAYGQTWPPVLGDPLALAPIPFGLGPVAVSGWGMLFGSLANGIISGAGGAAGALQGVEAVWTEWVQVTQGAEAVVEDGEQTAGRWVANAYNAASAEAEQEEQALVDFWHSAELALTFSTSPSGPHGSLLGSEPPTTPTGVHANDVTNCAPMAWLNVVFPAAATAMAFDFGLNGDPVDDVLVCGIGTSNLFTLEAKYIPTNTVSSSTLIDVSAWSGTTNELFFGFMGCTSTNATVTVDNIRFYSLAPPALDISLNGNVALLSWPLSAGGYVVETTPRLDSPNWATITNVPAIALDRYVLTNSLSDQARFFRLRQR